MGNSQTREQRAPPPTPPPGSQPSQQNLYTAADGVVYTARTTRPSQANLFGRSAIREEPQDEAALAQRRLNKAEKEARKKEEKEAARRKERERSMRDESVDGGYLVSSGLYISDEDYNKAVVRQLMIDRRLAPFFIGLEDHREDWAEHQLVAAVQSGGNSVPPADQPPDGVPHWPPADGPIPAASSPTSPQTIPSPSTSHGAMSVTSSPPLTSPNLLRGRTKTPPSLTMASSHVSAGMELQPLETTLPPQPLINGQRLEIFLYKDPVECEICYRSFPPFCNRSRCCDKPICSECFVSIKRKDPHPVEHDDEGAPPRPAEPQNPDSEFDLSEIDLVSEPAKCPFCKEEHFGISYQAPPFRSGLVYSGSRGPSFTDSPLPSPGTPIAGTPPVAGRPRAASLPANAAGVVTTDKIRPDWARKLLQAKLNAAKRARAATALHQQAFLPSSSRSRLGLFRRGTSEGAASSEDATDEGTPLDINGLIVAAATDRRRGQQELAGPRGRALAYQMAIESQYEEALARALRESVEDEQRRAAKAEKEREDEERRKAKEEKQRAKDEAKQEAKQQKQAAKAAKKSSSILSFPRAMRSSTSIISSDRRSSGSIDSGKGKAPAHSTSDALNRTSSGVSVSSSQAAGPSRAADSHSEESSTAQGGEASSLEANTSSKGGLAKTRSTSQTNFGSLAALMEKPENNKSSQGQTEGASDLGNFGRDMMSSMDNIMTRGGEQSGAAASNSPTFEPKRQEVEVANQPTTHEFGSA